MQPTSPQPVQWIDDNFQIAERVERAVKAFAKSKPFRGTTDERLDKFRRLGVLLRDAMSLNEAPIIDYDVDPHPTYGEFAGACRETNRIIISGKLSVVSYLHCYGRVAGMGCAEAQKWAVNLFARAFPRSMAGCVVDPASGLVRRRDDIDDASDEADE